MMKFPEILQDFAYNENNKSRTKPFLVLMLEKACVFVPFRFSVLKELKFAKGAKRQQKPR
ncbi:hypothetical protein HanPI659440_Chr04g0158791 [Helianthus annuus]|nr:hypothetical protein HanPI659440_Chr04g0158791 [Helianthus annuus]